MPSHRDHCLIDKRHLGRVFLHVHKWMDAFARMEGNAHRWNRHHEEGIEEVRGMFGDEAAKSARLHVVLDMGHIPTMSEWEVGGVLRQDGSFVHMDEMGILENPDMVLPSGIHLGAGTGYSTSLFCESCMEDTVQFLGDVSNGGFHCSRCHSVNRFPDYRISTRKNEMLVS